MNVHSVLICGLSVLSIAAFGEDAVTPVSAEPVSVEVASAPVAHITLADGAQTRAHFAKSVYSFIWNHDLLLTAREGLEKIDARDKQRGRLSITDLLKSIEYVRFNYDDFNFSSAGDQQSASGQSASGQIAAGDYTANIWNVLLKNSEEIPAVADADKSLRAENGMRASLFGNNIVAAIGSALLPPLAPAPDPASNLAADVSGSVQLGGFYQALADATQKLNPESAKSLQKCAVLFKDKNLAMTFQIKEKGIKESWTLELPYAYSSRVDESLLQLLPANTLCVGVMGISADYSRKMRELIGKTDINESGPQAKAIFDKIGVTDYNAFVESFDGTALCAVTPAVPFPALTFAIPRSDELDKYIITGLKNAGIVAPVLGEAATLPLPIPVPVMIQVGRSQSHWFVSSDPMLMDGLIKGTANTFKDGALAKKRATMQVDNLSALFLYDTKSLLQLGAQYAQFIPEQKIKQQTVDLLMKLQGKVDVGVATVTAKGESMYLETEGLLGVSVIPALGGAVAMPAVNSANASALRAANGNNLKQLATMIIKHRTDTRNTFPDPWKAAGLAFPKVDDAQGAMKITAAIFEYLAVTESLSPELFTQPGQEAVVLDLSMRSAKEIVENPNLDYAKYYALDWSTPKTSGTIRPMICTRFPTDGEILVVFADSHIGRAREFALKEASTIDGLRTQESIDKSSIWSVIHSDPAVDNDDIFSAAGDLEDGETERLFQIGKGSRTRAFMK